MPFISLKKGSKYLWFIVLCPVAYTLRDLAFKLLFKNKFTKQPMVVSSIMFMGECLAGIHTLISWCLTPKKNEKKKGVVLNSSHIDDSMRNNINFYSLRRTKTLLLIALSSFIDLVCYTSTSYMTKFPFIQTNNIHTEMRITPIFFMSLLSWKFFLFEIYNHHKVAILTMIIGFISLGVNIMIIFKDTDDFRYYHLFLFLFIHTFYSVKTFNDKYIMEKYFITPYVLLLCQGVFGLFVCLCYISFLSLFNDTNRSKYFPYFENDSFVKIADIFNNPNILGCLLLLAVTGCFVNIVLMLTKKFLTPTHRSIADSLNAFCTWLVWLTYYTDKDFWKNEWNWVKYFDIIGYILITLGCLMYNELIIVHVCGLDKDIKEHIEKRADQEIRETILSPISEIEPGEFNDNAVNN